LSRSRSFTFALRELGFGLLELAQALLLFTLEAARNETVLGIDSAIAAFGTMPRTGLRWRRGGTGRAHRRDPASTLLAAASAVSRPLEQAR
jgi:hypothetical protein